MAQFTHTTGTAKPETAVDPRYDTKIRIARGQTIYNPQTMRKRIIDQSLEVMARDTDDITFTCAFMHDGAEWTVGWEECTQL